jgi:hypothetical protein
MLIVIIGIFLIKKHLKRNNSVVMLLLVIMTTLLYFPNIGEAKTVSWSENLGWGTGISTEWFDFEPLSYMEAWVGFCQALVLVQDIMELLITLLQDKLI